MRWLLCTAAVVLLSCSGSESSSSPTGPSVSARAQATVTLQSGARVQLWADSLFFLNNGTRDDASFHYGSTCELTRVLISEVRRLDPVRRQPCNLGEYCGQCGSRRWIVFLDAAGRAEEASPNVDSIRGERVDSGQVISITFDDLVSLQK